jgi:methylase of polypeptide subunit release factors
VKRTLLKRALRAASRPLRSSRRVTRLLFGVNATSRLHPDLWDLTTLVLKKALDELLQDGDRVLELGTGHIGVLGIHCAKLRRVDLTAVDVSSAFIDNARSVARASHAPSIDFRTSDWFSAVDGRFDLVFVNLPYVPTATGLAWGASSTHAQTWDGGADGCDTARSVLSQAGPHLSERGRLLLGVNRVYVSRAKMLEVLAMFQAFALERVVTSRVSPGEVYVVRAAPGQAA